MDKQTGTIITIVVAVLSLCCSVTCCGVGLYHALFEEVIDIEQPYGFITICPAILVWVIPVLLWVFLVRNQEQKEEGMGEEFDEIV